MEKIAQHTWNEGLDLAGALGRCSVVSLSHPVSPEMPHWPGDPRTEFGVWSDPAKDGYFVRRFSMGEHSGTHLTAPASYFADGKSVDQFTPGELVRPAIVINVREQCRGDPDYALPLSEVLAWENLHGAIQPGHLALLNTGWAERWHDPAAYLGDTATDGLHFPGFGYEAASFLVNERDVGGLGTDTAGIEPGTDSGLSVSKLVLAEPRIALENLANLDRLPPAGAVVVVGVLRLVGGSGSPAAITAFVPGKNE